MFKFLRDTLMHHFDLTYDQVTYIFAGYGGILTIFFILCGIFAIRGWIVSGKEIKKNNDV
jgi:hypothetical protein